MLTLSDISVSYGMIAALKGVSLEVRQGEIVALIGANGRANRRRSCPSRASPDFPGRSPMVTVPSRGCLPARSSNSASARCPREDDDSAADAFNLEEVRDFMPQMGPMVGYAVTVVFQPSDAARRKQGAKLWSEYRRYFASVPGSKVVVVQDLDKPKTVGAGNRSRAWTR